MRSPARSGIAAALAAVLALAAAGPVASAQRGQAAALPDVGFSADAYGAQVSAGHALHSGKLVPSAIGCFATPGTHAEHHLASVSLPPALTTAAIDTSADALAVPGGVAARAEATVHDASLLGGLITADEVEAVSQTTQTASGTSTSASGSMLVNLVVLGVPIAATPDPNTRIDLPGIGYVVLNEQTGKARGLHASLTVNMLHVFVTLPNLLGLAPGTQIVVAHAHSALSQHRGDLDGGAYLAKLKVGPLVDPGRIDSIGLPCTGTNGSVRSKDVVGLSVPGIVTSGTGHVEVQGDDTGDPVTSRAAAQIEGLNLLTGLVTADVVDAQAQASETGAGTKSFGDAGSQFTNLSVLGHPEIGANPPPNTRVDLAGLGVLWLHRVIQKTSSIEVRMVELQVLQPNSFGLPVGGDLRLAVAHASVH